MYRKARDCPAEVPDSSHKSGPTAVVGWLVKEKEREKARNSKGSRWNESNSSAVKIKAVVKQSCPGDLYNKKRETFFSSPFVAKQSPPKEGVCMCCIKITEHT